MCKYESNNHPTVYAGLDIHKSTLQLYLAGRDYELPITSSGHRKLLAFLAKHQNTHVICEAPGGYERSVVVALHAAEVPVSVLNPAQARNFARALGQRAKTDPLDTKLLSAYGKALQPPPTLPRTPTERQLVELMRYRLQLIEKIVAERQQAEMLEHAALTRQSRALVRCRSYGDRPKALRICDLFADDIRDPNGIDPSLKIGLLVSVTISDDKLF